MNYGYIKKIEALMTDEDKKLLKKIYEPTVVCYPFYYAHQNLCVTDDGEIRYYSLTDKDSYADNKQRVYFASNDAGLSWKMHLVPDGIIGRAHKSEISGRYFSFKYINDGENSGTYVLFANGYDEAPFMKKKLCDHPVYARESVIFLKDKKRYLVATEGDTGNGFSSAVVFWSDDDCETWQSTKPEVVPNLEFKPPHKGPRWHNSCEPTIIERNDGSVMMIVRTSQNVHYVYYSYDGGESWTKPKPTGFHSTLTMPTLYRLSDNRLIFLWCNTQPLPETDHESVLPPLHITEIDGTWEDVFTNRDANHAAISEDDGKTWIGFREMYLNPVRNSADFRTSGGGYKLHDKSVHQIECLELPFNKLLVFAGQHDYCTRGIIFDIDYLYDKSRKEDFTHGLINMSTHVYLKSISGGFQHFSGHCAWNRTNGAVLVPDPDYKEREEVLFFSVTDDERLVSNVQGASWNFPAARNGEVAVKMRVKGRGLRLSLIDRWMNPIDDEIINDAAASYVVTKDFAPDGKWSDIKIRWDLDKKEFKIFSGNTEIESGSICGDFPNGLSYLHLQTVGEAPDTDGAYVKLIEMKSI